MEITENIEETLKAGCILVNKQTKKIGLIYRTKHNDYEFPKGHLEENETIMECAIRETAEETKRNVKLILDFEPYQITYTTKKGEHCRCYYYLGEDLGNSDNTSTDTHDLHWLNIENIESTLTYSNTLKVWEYFKPKLIKYFNF